MSDDTASIARRGASGIHPFPRPLDAPRAAAAVPDGVAGQRQCVPCGARGGHVAIQRAPVAAKAGGDDVRPDMGTGIGAACGAHGRFLRRSDAQQTVKSVASLSPCWRAPVAWVTRRWRVSVAFAAHCGRLSRFTPDDGVNFNLSRRCDPESSIFKLARPSRISPHDGDPVVSEALLIENFTSPRLDPPDF